MCDSLRGLFIWAVTQDSKDWNMLDAVLYPDGLGKFRERNGYHEDVDGDWKSRGDDNCYLSPCDGKCRAGEQDIGKVRCDWANDHAPYSRICCPFGEAPNPADCQWRANKLGFWCLGNNKCQLHEKSILKHNWYRTGSGLDDDCWLGTKAEYCCATERDAVCKWSGKCMSKSSPSSEVCPSGFEVATWRGGDCNVGKGWWEAFCCEAKASPTCEWRMDYKDCSSSCKAGEKSYGRHMYGGGMDVCEDPEYPVSKYHPTLPPGRGGWFGPMLCCDRESVRLPTSNLPVPIENLFDEYEDMQDDHHEYDIVVDVDRPNESRHPNDNSFGFWVMSGPENELTSLDKRDGSDWHVYDCDDEPHEGEQTARLVSTREYKGPGNHNCDKIYKGTGVKDTIIELPPHCGPGRYALAISLERKHALRDDGVIHPRLKRSLPEETTVYELKFDYGFHRLQGRQGMNTRIRIDYSNAVDYWENVVGTLILSRYFQGVAHLADTHTTHLTAAAPSSPQDKKLRRRSDDEMEQIRHVVKRDHGGSWKRYLEHSYHEEKRNTPPEKLHELHERWYSAGISDWIARMRNVQYDVDLLDQRISKTFAYKILDEHRDCEWPKGSGMRLTMGAEVTAVITADVGTSAVLTLVGHIASLFFSFSLPFLGHLSLCLLVASDLLL